MRKTYRTVRARLAFSAWFGSAVVLATVSVQADAAPGSPPSAFIRCTACHSVQPGVNIVGPSLGDVMGRQAASLDGFRFSGAMRRSGIRWDARTLDNFLAQPQQAVPGNRMAFSGLSDAGERKIIIDYLGSLHTSAPAH